MKKIELLSPAGDYKSLEMAIDAGADAVYVSLKSYGARAFAPNFTMDEIKSAIKLCHLYGVRLYVTMNTLVKDTEVDDFLEKVKFLYLEGVDALIMQDLGMICLVRQMYPDLEIHASTQFNNSSKDTLILLKKLGVKRAVLSRELSIDEIKMMDVDIEKEIFIHGALCVSYSGCCLFSSMIGHRSGNRGECTGCCRLPYKLETNGKIVNSGYLLSMKELNTTKRIKELLNSGVCSLKIEGRMKSSSYVYFITKFYRRLIDGVDVDIDKEEEKLKILFNREFTFGHLFNINDSNLLNTKSPNHQGKTIGKVISVNKNRIKIKLDYPLHQEDGIRFMESKKGLVVNFLYDKNNKLTSCAENICYVDNKIGLTSLDKVNLTSSKVLEKEILAYEKRKVDVSFKLVTKASEPLKLIVSDGINKVLLTGKIVAKALNSPTTEDRIRKQLQKTNDTVYRVKDITVDMDEQLFIPIKELNEIRREILDKLTELRTKVKEKRICDVNFSKLDVEVLPAKSILVNDLANFLKAIDDKYDRIYVTKKDIYDKYKNKYPNIYYSGRRNLLNVCFYEKNLIHDICLSKTKNDICDYTFNVFNRYTVYYLHKMGYKCVTLSLELTYEDIKLLQKEFVATFGFKPNLEVFALGRAELMIIKGDLLKCRDTSFLIDSKNRRFPVFYDGVYTHVYNYLKRNKLDFYEHNLDEVSLRVDTTFM